MRMKRYNQSRIEAEAQKTISVLRGTISPFFQVNDIVRMIGGHHPRIPFLTQMVYHNTSGPARIKPFLWCRGVPLRSVKITMGARQLGNLVCTSVIWHDDVNPFSGRSAIYLGRDHV